MLLHDLGMGADENMVLNEDNQSCIAFAKSHGDHRRSKRIDVRYHFVNEMIAEKQIVMNHVAREFQIAEMLTKAFAPPSFMYLRIMMLGERRRGRREI